MGLFDFLKGAPAGAVGPTAGQVAGRALERIEAGDEAAGWRELAEHVDRLGATAHVVVAMTLRDAGRDAGAREAVQQALAARPDDRDALMLRAELFLEDGDVERAIAAWRRVLELDDDDDLAAANLAETLAGSDRARDAMGVLEPWIDASEPLFDDDDELDGADESVPIHVRIAAARVVLAAGRSGEALESLVRIGDRLEAQSRAATSRDQMDALAQDRFAAELVVNDAWRGAHGSRGDAVQGSLRRKVGEALGRLRTATSEPGALASPDHDVAASSAAREGGNAFLAEILEAQAALRTGDPAGALAALHEARRLAPDHFAPHLGMASALLLRDGPSLALVDAMRVPRDLPEGARELLPDLDALAPLERTVVGASLVPFGGLVGTLARSGARLRILPLAALAHEDAELASAAAARTVASGVVAGPPGRAAVKVEDLLDVESGTSWGFAHALALLAFPHLAPTVRGKIAELRRATAEQRSAAEPVEEEEGPADGAEVTTSHLDLESDERFFAALVEDWLRARHGAPSLREPDDEGLDERGLQLVDRLSG